MSKVGNIKPNVFEIAITDYCNLNCKFCSQGTPLQKNKKTIFLTDLERVSKYIRPYEFGTIKISGGEPTLHPQFREICLSLRRLFPANNYVLATNGFKLSRFSDCLNIFSKIDLSHYPGLNDNILTQPIVQLPNVICRTNIDYERMKNVYQELNHNKEQIYTNCVFSKIWKLVQDRIYPCCVIFGQSVRQEIESKLIGVEIDERWRDNIAELDIEPYCKRCFVDVKALPSTHRGVIHIPQERNATQIIHAGSKLQSFTIFSMPKPFQGQTGIIQCNAIKSWTLLEPRPEIVLFGNDKGVAEIAKEFEVRHIPDVERNEYGTPLVNSIFELAEANSTTDWLCYVNSDVILMDDFVRSQAILQSSMEGAGVKKFLMFSQRREVDVRSKIEFDEQKKWQVWLRNEVLLHSALDHKAAVEMFFYSRGLYSDVPDFALGRFRWDHWLVWKAQQEGAAIIDATEAFKLVHQLHDYGHAKEGICGILAGQECKNNYKLSESQNIIVAEVVTHFLTEDGLFIGQLLDKADNTSIVKIRINRGRYELEQGNYAAALDYFDDAGRRNGQSQPLFHFYRAKCLRHLGRWSEAQKAIEAESKRRPKDAEVQSLLEEIYAGSKIEANELSMRGLQKLRENKLTEAMAFFNQAVSICPVLDNLHFAMATAMVQLGKVSAARQECLAELELQPGHPGTTMLLERIDKAIAEFQQSKVCNNRR